MNMVPVTSSNIKEIGHDPVTNTLGIRFKDQNGPGELWHYRDVPAEKHAALMAATDSHGKHFHANIKGKHAGARVDD